MSKTKIKICGITRADQATEIALLGADALGFIFYPPSPRYIDPHKAARIISAVPPFTKTVGVFADERFDTVVEIAKTCRLDLVQLSGEESPDYCNQLQQKGVSWIKGIRVRSEASLIGLESYNTHYFLLDAWSDKEYGGTGKVFDWSLLERFCQKYQIILAGGINSQNVIRAINLVKPYGIDVSSGVETAPGIKSISLVNQLIESVRSAASD